MPAVDVEAIAVVGRGTSEARKRSAAKPARAFAGSGTHRRRRQACRGSIQLAAGAPARTRAGGRDCARAAWPAPTRHEAMTPAIGLSPGSRPNPTRAPRCERAARQRSRTNPTSPQSGCRSTWLAFTFSMRVVVSSARAPRPTRPAPPRRGQMLALVLRDVSRCAPGAAYERARLHLHHRADGARCCPRA